MKITYGIIDNTVDVTDLCINKLKKDNYLIIPSNDNVRANYFGDHIVGVLKTIFITTDEIIREYDHTKKIFFDLNTNKVLEPESVYILDPDEHLKHIHNKLTLFYGSFQEELPEQRMAVKYINQNNKVLEIGGNIGRNSLVIAYLLQNQLDMVVLETDKIFATQLQHNRDQNQFKFHIENSALSNRKLIQKSWDGTSIPDTASATIASDYVLPGYVDVSIISYKELISKYNIAFDTLVLDCEGAFYYILQDIPDVLNGIQTIIMENDYFVLDHKKYVDDTLESHGFKVSYQEAGGWGPCADRFFEVWKRTIKVI